MLFLNGAAGYFFNGVLAADDGALLSSFFTEVGPLRPPAPVSILLVVFEGVGREIVPIDVYGRVLAGALSLSGTGVFVAAVVAVVVGLFNPPPIDGFGVYVTFASSFFAAVPLDEFKVVDGAAFGTPSFD